MVARVTTLQAAGGRLQGLVDYYAGLAEDRATNGRSRGPADYYLDAGEPAGRWHGSGRAALDLSELVTGPQLRALLAGEHPTSGATLGRSFGEGSARGFDVTFSAPKSVSVLWALHPDAAVRDATAASHDAAVAATVAWIETHGAVTRRGRQGVHQVDTRGLAVAVFRQHTSRTADPHLHSHAIVSSKVQDDTGRWLSLDARWLKRQQRSISWVYDAALRSELTRRVGIRWDAVPAGSGQSDVSGVRRELLELFSERSRQVSSKLSQLLARWSNEHQGAEPSARTIALLERQAVVTSRPGKHGPVDAAVLRREWEGRATTAGLDVTTLPGVAREPRPAPATVPGFVPGPAFDLDRELLVETAIARAAAESATWLPADLSRHLAALLPPNPGGSEALIETVDRLTAQAVARCRALSPDPATSTKRRDGRPLVEAVTDRRLTTTAVWDEETRLLRWAERSVGRDQVPDPGPVAAAEAMAGTRPLVLVVGPAGAGKTMAIAVGVRQLESQGRPVIGLAPSGKAADVLESETGCPSLTLAKLLHDAHHDRPVPPVGTTVVLDEAGMAATQDLAQLVALADRHAWRMVAVGDPAQLPAVGRGGMFAHWCRSLPAIRLDTVHRFVNDWEARASLQLRNGEPASIDAYEAHGRLRAVHPALLASRVADQYDRLESHDKTIAVTTTSQVTARAINLEIQRRRRPVGRRVALADGTTAAVGDRIATRRNDPTVPTSTGDSVRNRQTWTVTNVGADGSLTVTDAGGREARLPAAYVATHVELGWAVTGYGNQGTTTDVGLAVIEPTSSRAALYVAMTRGRERNTAWVVDRSGTADPSQVLRDLITRPSVALTAHEVHRQLHAKEPAPVRTRGVELSR
jgi:conjugative relaxase-like TrwC/TraI family protein